jgi:hypothetical protein
MGKLTFNPEHRAILDALLLRIPGVVAGNMFGYPAYYVNAKLFACVYGEGVGVKVPEEVATKPLSRRHIVPFQPLGRPRMREWIQINRKISADYRKDLDILQASIAFVGRFSHAKGKKNRRRTGSSGS